MFDSSTSTTIRSNEAEIGLVSSTSATIITNEATIGFDSSTSATISTSISLGNENSNVLPAASNQELNIPDCPPELNEGTIGLDSSMSATISTSITIGNEDSNVIPAASDQNLRIPDCPPELKPVVGMRFVTLQHGIHFYRRYATACGFVSRLASSKLKGPNVSHKYVVCNKQGNTVAKGTKQKRQMTRVNCKAKIVLKHIGQGHYQILRFVEGHGHLLATPNTMAHLKQTRELNLVHKKIILDNSKTNHGPVKSFRMFKEYVRGYNNIGASLEDFKNFSRDVKKFIKASDAQMLIEMFMHKRGMCKSFYFDFDVDDEGRLSRIFWADPIGIKNYILFGDMVSFDTTFDMNTYKMVFAPFTGVDHHKRCVTFAAGLLSDESADSFSWLFDCFVKAMGGRFPVCLITDQDLGIKAGVERVFGEKTQHRYCMWHILKKLPEKVGSTICRETNFLSEISSCVWAEDMEPNEFEDKWCSVVTSNGLTDNEWLKQMYEIRKTWVPAYFRDLFLGGIMRTTSRSESENNFFGNFTNPHLTLVEFWMRFESAMDAQRWKQSKLIADSKYSFPALVTPLSLEKHASERYTPTIFFEFQEELKAACYSCRVESIHQNDDSDRISVFDHDRKKGYVVDFKSKNEELTCSCKKFERHSILCRHAILIFKDRRFEKIPDTYLISRWSKLATCQPIFDVDGTLLNDCKSLDVTKNKISELWSDMFTCVSLIEQKPEFMEDMIVLLKGFKEKVLENTSGTTTSTRDKRAELEMLIGTSIPSEVTVLPPKQSKNKGSGKRLMSEKEKAVQERKKPARQCKACGEMGHHDSRNCPSKI